MASGTRSYNAFRFRGVSVQYLNDRMTWEYMPASSQSTFFEFIKSSSRADRATPVAIDAERVIDVISMKQYNTRTHTERSIRLHLDVCSVAPQEFKFWSVEQDDGSFLSSEMLTCHAIAWSRVASTFREPMDHVTLFMCGGEYTVDKDWKVQRNSITGRKRAIRAPGVVQIPVVAPIHPNPTHQYSEDLCCPITLGPFTDPVIASDGKTYERSALQTWLQRSDKSPLTGLPLKSREFVVDEEMRRTLQKLSH